MAALQLVGKLSFIVIMALIYLLLKVFPPGHERVFIERDPAISYPYIKDQLVPMWLLALIAIALPAIVMFLFQLYLHFSLKIVQRNFWDLQIGLGQAHFLCLVATDLLKQYCRRPRPNFFALCDYKGYRLATQTGNFEAYLNATTPGAFGDSSLCAASAADIHEAQLSFPSGHSSHAFAGLVFLSIFLFNVLQPSLLNCRVCEPHALWGSTSAALPRVLAALVPLLGACLVAAGRTVDYWHNFDDVAVGGLLGIASAALVFAAVCQPDLKLPAGKGHSFLDEELDV